MLLLAACSGGSGEVESFLTRTEKLLLSDPQSAYDSLNAVKSKVSDWSHSLQMRYWFDYIDAKNQYYIPLEEQEDLDRMTEVADYYDGDDEREARAYYLLGSVYRDQGDGPQAIDCWQKGIEKAKSKKQKDNRLIALAYRQMGRIYRDQLLIKEAIQTFDSAYFYSVQCLDSSLAAYSYIDKTVAFYLTQNMDSVLMRNNNVSKNPLFSSYRDVIAMPLSLSALIYLDKGEWLKAKYYLTIYENESNMVQEDGNPVRGAEIYYYTKGFCLLEEGKYRKAMSNFERLDSVANDWNLRQAAYKGLAMYYEKTGQLDSALYYRKQQITAADSTYFEQNAALSLQFNKSYNYSQHQRIAKETTEKNAKLRLLLSIVLFVFITTIAISWFIHYKTKNKQTMERERLKAIIANYNSKLAQLQINIMEKEKQLDEINSLISGRQIHVAEQSLIEEKEELLKELENLRKDKEQHEKTNIYTSRIISELKEKAKHNKHATDTDFQTLEGYTRNVFPSMFAALEKLPKEVNYKEIVICILKKHNFSNKQMAILLSKSESTICSIRSRLYQKAHKGEHASMKIVDQWIMQL